MHGNLNVMAFDATLLGANNVVCCIHMAYIASPYWIGEYSNAGGVGNLSAVSVATRMAT
jgi:hypothetical protein